jgi:DNA-binding NarL/FixJ family response regulator
MMWRGLEKWGCDMSDIPKVREEMQELADKIRSDDARDFIPKIFIANQLEDWIERMKRKQHRKRAPITQVTAFTPDDKARIRLCAAEGQSNQEIANKLGVNPGRISEVLAEETT